MENNLLYQFDLEKGKEIIGVDEAGRGPLAGSVVAAAVKLKRYSEELQEINDSKKLTEKKFDINLLWIMSDTGKYIEIENNAQKIKKKM